MGPDEINQQWQAVIGCAPSGSLAFAGGVEADGGSTLVSTEKGMGVGAETLLELA